MKWVWWVCAYFYEMKLRLMLLVVYQLVPPIFFSLGTVQIQVQMKKLCIEEIMMSSPVDLFHQFHTKTDRACSIPWLEKCTMNESTKSRILHNTIPNALHVTWYFIIPLPWSCYPHFLWWCASLCSLLLYYFVQSHGFIYKLFIINRY